jgi:hypothetical protein
MVRLVEGEVKLLSLRGLVGVGASPSEITIKRDDLLYASMVPSCRSITLQR